MKSSKLLPLMLNSCWSTLLLRHAHKRHKGTLNGRSSLQLLMLTRRWGLELAKLVLS